MKAILAALRTSEFWALAFQVIVESLNAPVPEEFNLIIWAYIGLRIIGKLAKFVFPNPESANAGWIKKDS